MPRIDIADDGGDGLLRLRDVSHCRSAAPNPLPSKLIQRGKLTLDLERHSCIWDEKQVSLTITEFRLMQALVQRRGVVRSRDALLGAVRQRDACALDRSIDRHIQRIRKKLKRVDAGFDRIKTLYGLGYCYCEDG